MAVSKTFDISLETIQTASMLTGDIGEVASLIAVKGKLAVEHLGFRIFRPTMPMMAQMATGVKEVLNEAGGAVAFEYKLDGARIQIHKSGDEVRVYSRRLTDVTESLPEVVQLIRTQVKAGQVILEGEVIAVGEDRASPLLFQHLMRNAHETAL